MTKLMLVVDDFNELIMLESLLRRLGFDVLSLGRDVLVNDALLRFHPDLVIASAKGRAVDGLKLASRIRKVTPAPGLILLHPPGFQLPSDARLVDALLESPAQPRKAIEIVSRLLNLDTVSLLDKYEKIATKRASENNSAQIISGKPHEKKDSHFIVSGKTPATEERTSRTDRYERFLKANAEEPEQKVLPTEAMKAAMEKLAKVAEQDQEELEELNAEKLAFAKALFSDDK